jgi:hypothetical protein
MMLGDDYNLPRWRSSSSCCSNGRTPAAGWPSMAVILDSQHQEGQAGDEDELAKRHHES